MPSFPFLSHLVFLHISLPSLLVLLSSYLALSDPGLSVARTYRRRVGRSRRLDFGPVPDPLGHLRKPETWSEDG